MGIIRYLVYTNVFISICAVALTTFCNLLFFDEFPENNLIGFIFFSTLFAYNFHRRVGKGDNTLNTIPRKDQWMNRNSKLIHVLIFLSFGLAAYYYYYLPKAILILIFPLGLISIFYVLEINKLPSLRSLPFLKIFIIAFVWGGVTVLLPLFNSYAMGFALEWDNQLLALSMALFVFGETLPFDIRDLNEDRFNGLKTLPQKIGIKKSKYLSIGLYLFSFSLFFLFVKYNNKDHLYLLSYGLSISYSLFWIMRINSKKNELYYSLGVESALCMPLFFYYLLNSF